MARPRLGAAGIVALLACAVAVGVDAWAAFGCPFSEVSEVSSPSGGPASAAAPHCAGGFNAELALFVLPPLVAAAGLFARLPVLAWTGGAVEAVGALVFWPGVAAVHVPRILAAALLLAGLAWWQVARSRRPPTSSATPLMPAQGPARRSRLLIGSIAGGVVVASLAALWLASSLPQFWDPCFTFGEPSTGTHTAVAGGPCSTSGGTSLTRGQEMGIMASIGGVPLALGVLGAFAAGRKAGALLLGAGIALAVHAVALFFLGLPVLLLWGPVAALWIAAGSAHRSPQPAPPPA